MTSLSVHLQCMGKVKKKKLSVKSERHEFSHSSLTMYGQSEETRGSGEPVSLT